VRIGYALQEQQSGIRDSILGLREIPDFNPPGQAEATEAGRVEPVSCGNSSLQCRGGSAYRVRTPNAKGRAEPIEEGLGGCPAPNTGYGWSTDTAGDFPKITPPIAGRAERGLRHGPKAPTTALYSPFILRSNLTA